MACRALCTELRGLSPELLADLGIDRGSITTFASWATFGSDEREQGLARRDETTTRIGSETWSRVFLLHLHP